MHSNANTNGHSNEMCRLNDLSNADSRMCIGSHSHSLTRLVALFITSTLAIRLEYTHITYKLDSCVAWEILRSVSQDRPCGGVVILWDRSTNDCVKYIDT